MSWSILPELSAWHAADLISKGFAGVQAEVANGIAPLVERIGAASIQDQVATLGNSETTSLNDSFELYETVRAIVPIADELATRIGPLKMQWEARGPGMLQQLSHYILAADAPPANAPEIEPVQILPVYPWAGGHVQSLPSSNAVMVEALLTDVDSQLPEVVRLAWGHAQLLSRSAYAASKTKAPASIHLLATIMPALAAAESVQSASCDASTVEKAISMWLHNPPTEEAVTTLMTWWTEWSRELAGGTADWPMAVSAIGA